MGEKIPIIMLIDVEPDGFFIDRTKPLPWKGYEGAFQYFSELRTKLEERTGSPAHFTWCYRLDPQVAETYGSADWPLKHYSRVTEDFLRNGDEIALHPHAYRWIEKKQNWIEDLGDQEWVNYCLEIGFAAYERLFHKACEVFRFGAYWINSETINMAEKLGAQFDLTVEPGFKIRKRLFPEDYYSALLPDYDHCPNAPYRPSRTDFTRPDATRKDGIWVIPISTGKVNYQYGRLETLKKRMFSPDELKPRTVTLNLARGANGFRSVMEDLLKSLERPYLAMVVRSDVCGDALSNPTDPVNMGRNVDYILNHALVKQFVFSTPREAMSTMGYLNGPDTSLRGGREADEAISEIASPLRGSP